MARVWSGSVVVVVVFSLTIQHLERLKLFTALRKENMTNFGYAPEFVSRLFCSGIKSKIKQKNLRVPGGSKTSNCLEFTTQGCRITSDCKTNENHIK